MKRKTATLHELQLEPANQGVIQALEGALKQAREGQLSMVCITAVERDGCPRYWTSQVHNRSLMIGGMVRHVYRLLHEAETE
jgi:hypothetical protein